MGRHPLLRRSGGRVLFARAPESVIHGEPAAPAPVLQAEVTGSPSGASSAGGLLPFKGSAGPIPAPGLSTCAQAGDSLAHDTKLSVAGRAPGGSSPPVTVTGVAAAGEGGLAGGRGAARPLRLASAGAGPSEVVAALQQGGDGVVQGHGHLLGGLAQQRAVGVVLLQVQDVALLALGRAATLLAHVQLGPPLLVRVLLLHAVYLLEVGLQRAALREGLVAQAAFVGPHACGGEQGRASGAGRGARRQLPGRREACPSPTPQAT